MSKVERYFGIDVRDAIERAAWTVAPIIAGWLLAHVPSLVDFAGGQETTVAAVAAALVWALTYLWRTVSPRLPNPGDGLTRRLPTARGMGAGWRQAGPGPHTAGPGAGYDEVRTRRRRGR